MASTWQTVTASVVLATAGALITGSAEAQKAPPSLTVVIHDYAALPPAVVQQARDVATRIYRQIDVQLTWWDANRFAAETPADLAAHLDFLASVFHVRLVRGLPEGQRPQAAAELGHAVPGSHMASVLVERVEYVASHGGQDFANLLGHVMAHELGHLLLPANSHSDRGIMAATMDLFLVGHGGLFFDQRQALVIRTRVASMSGRR